MRVLTAVVTQETKAQRKAANGLDEKLAHIAGGFTRALSEGAWLNSRADIVREKGFLYIVALQDALTECAVVDLFRSWARDAGEAELFYTVREEEAHFVGIREEVNATA